MLITKRQKTKDELDLQLFKEQIKTKTHFLA